MTVVSGNADHDCSSMAITSSIVIFDNSLLDSQALMYLQITFARYVVFNDRIIPLSIGCATEVVFGGKKMRSTAVKSGTCGWAGQLSTIDATLRF